MVLWFHGVQARRQGVRLVDVPQVGAGCLFGAAGCCIGCNHSAACHRGSPLRQYAELLQVPIGVDEEGKRAPQSGECGYAVVKCMPCGMQAAGAAACALGSHAILFASAACPLNLRACQAWLTAQQWQLWTNGAG